MKKEFASLLFVFLLIAPFGLSAQIKYGFSLDLNSSKSVLDYHSGSTPYAKSIFPASLHFLLEKSLNPDLSVRIGLGYVRKGWQQDFKATADLAHQLDPTSEVSYDAGSYRKLMISYLDLPVNLVCHKNKFSFLAGFYLGYGITGLADGKIKGVEKQLVKEGNYSYYDYLPVEYSEKKQVRFNQYATPDISANHVVVKPLDYGYQLGLNYQLSDQFLLGVQYSAGLTNYMAGTDINGTKNKSLNEEKHRLLTFSLICFKHK